MHHDGLSGLLELSVKEHTVQMLGTKNLLSKEQIALFGIVSRIFPGHSPIMNYHHPDLRFQKTKSNMELDIFLPSLGLAFEYNGAQHYKNQSIYTTVDVPQQLVRDEEKKLVRWLYIIKSYLYRLVNNLE
jgi:hypothetical protein